MGVNSGNGSDDMIFPLMFIGRDYQTPEGLFAADKAWKERTYRKIVDEKYIKNILPDLASNTLNNVRGPFKDFKLDENGNAVDWQEYYEVNGVRVPAEVYEARGDAEIAKLMGITTEELRDRVASLLPQISSGKDVPPVILQEPDKRPQE